MRTVSQDERGFTLIEMLLVVAIMGTLAAMAVVVGPNFLRQARADSGITQVVETLRTAREMAISQRRNVQIRFNGLDTIETAREDLAPAVGTTVLKTIVLENRVQFKLATGVPDTPDRFGCSTNGTSSTAPCNPPIAAVAFGPSATRAFTSEGTLVDVNGDPVNGTVFMSIPGVANSSRAVTVFGTTGLIRQWHWNGRDWVE